MVCGDSETLGRLTAAQTRMVRAAFTPAGPVYPLAG